MPKFLIFAILCFIGVSTYQALQAQGVVTECNFVEMADGKKQYNCQPELVNIVTEIGDWVNRSPQDKAVVSGLWTAMNFFQFLLSREELFKEMYGLNRATFQQQWQYQADDLLAQNRPSSMYPTIQSVDGVVVVQSYRCYQNGCHEWTTLVYDRFKDRLSICMVVVPISLIHQITIAPQIMQSLQVLLFVFSNKKLQKSTSIRMDQVQHQPGYVCGNKEHDARLVVDRVDQLRWYQ